MEGGNVVGSVVPHPRRAKESLRISASGKREG